MVLHPTPTISSFCNQRLFCPLHPQMARTLVGENVAKAKQKASSKQDAYVMTMFGKTEKSSG
jgi:hypothetical protein